MNRQRGLNAVSVSLILLSASLPLFAAEWHVAPDGGAGGDGSAAKPWSLKAALEHPATVKPGDTIWLHEGTYTGHFQGNLKGTPEAPIIVRQYPGERAIIDGNFNRLIAGNGSNVFGVAGAWTWYWGFEIRKMDRRSWVLVRVVKYWRAFWPSCCVSIR